MTPEPCTCDSPGYCARYGREMRGRFYELCHGVNADLGTAAAFREQWDREAAVKEQSTTPPRRLLLKTDQAPGDAVALTAAIYSLHRAHPGRYVTAVESDYPEVFAHNPDVVSAAPGDEPVQMHYPAIHQSNERGIHFMHGWCEFLGMALGVDVPLLTDRPRLYFNEPEPAIDDYWIVCSGGKRDFTAKLWGHHNYQTVVSTLTGKVKFIQVGAYGGDHPHLSGVIDLVGHTDLRQLFILARRARGVLCGVSLLMHVAAALDRPSVVVAGGREPVAWNAYPRQQYVHTVGALSCTSVQRHVGRACWRGRTVPLGDSAYLDRHPCERPVVADQRMTNRTPVPTAENATPACMALISPNDVASLVLRYNKQYE